MDAECASELTLEDMRCIASELLERPRAAVGDDDDLITLGIDSVRIMRFANELRRWGVDATFRELVEEPSLGAWWAIVEPRRGRARPAPVEADVDENEPFALAPMQQAYWVGRTDGQALGGVAAHFYAELDGDGVEPERLTAAVHALLRRHGMLRARFLADGSQQIMPTSPWEAVTVHRLDDLPDPMVPDEQERVRQRLSHRRFDVEHGEVFDVQLSVLPGGVTRLHVNIDMLIADASSFQLILGELALLYAEPERALPPLAYTFPRYLATLPALREDARARAVAYWDEQLPEMPAGPQLPLATNPRHVSGARVGRRFHAIDRAQWDRLADRSRSAGLTLPVTFATAFAEVIGAWSAEKRFLLNLPLFDRETVHPDVPRLVGDFSNLLVLATDVSVERSFLEQARLLQARLRADISHAELSGLEVLRALARERPDDRIAAPVVFTSTLGMGELFDELVRGELGEPGWTTSQTPQVWLDQQVTERDGGLLVNWDVVEALFPAGVVDAMFAAYVGLLEWLAGEDTDWECPVPSLVPVDQLARRAKVNATDGPESGRRLHEGFFTAAADGPDRVALAWGDDGELTYGALSRWARQTAALLAARGVQSGDAVAVTVPKGAAQVAAVLGVLAAGGVYVPVGVDQPPERRDRIYRNAGAVVALTADDVESARHIDPIPAPVPGVGDDLAYVIYTSGSTGEPKGVEITHRAAVNTIDDINDRYHLDHHDRVLAVSALDFDLSVYDLFGLLAVGGTVVLVDEADRREARRWVDLIRRWDVTVWNSVPALLDMALVAAGDQGLRPLRLAMVSGDWVGLDLPDRLHHASAHCRFVALGGATEAAIWSNAYEVDHVADHWRSIPYGHPLRNQRFRVVDHRGRDCPDWVPGELWIGGTGVARGYRGDPTTTTDRFVHHDNQNWYRTGDLGRYWPDGTLEFLGRVDHQVKIRGHRIELGDIETALETHPQLRHAVVLTTGEPRHPRLCAVVVPTTDDLDDTTIATYLADRLPHYMIPATYITLDQLPLTPNGKIDHNALRRLAALETPEPTDQPPQTPTETTLAHLWAELLDTPTIGRHDNFIALGGDSLLATRLVERLRAIGFEAALQALFDAPVLKDFAATLKATDGDAASHPILVHDLEHRHEPFPATDVQQAYWLGRTDAFALGGVGAHWYWEFDGVDVDVDRLEDALDRVIGRHEMLRAVFDRDGRQRILPVVPPATITRDGPRRGVRRRARCPPGGHEPPSARPVDVAGVRRPGAALRGPDSGSRSASTTSCSTP